MESSDYNRIHEIPILEIVVKTYKDRVCQLDIITKKDARLMKALQSVFGPADYDLNIKVYFWKTNSLALKFKSQSKSRLQLTSISYEIFKAMKEDRNKNVHNTAEDL